MSIPDPNRDPTLKSYIKKNILKILLKTIHLLNNALLFIYLPCIFLWCMESCYVLAGTVRYLYLIRSDPDSYPDPAYPQWSDPDPNLVQNRPCLLHKLLALILACTSHFIRIFSNYMQYCTVMLLCFLKTWICIYMSLFTGYLILNRSLSRCLLVSGF